jgi:hypothetical protein
MDAPGEFVRKLLFLRSHLVDSPAQHLCGFKVIKGMSPLRNVQTSYPMSCSPPRKERMKFRGEKVKTIWLRTIFNLIITNL